MSYTIPSDTSAGSFLEKTGSYHLYVTSVKERPLVKHEIKDQIHFQCQVLAGTESSEIDHTVLIRLNLPSSTHKDGGDFSNRVLYRMARSLGLVPANAKSGQTVDDPVWKDGEDGQFVVDIVMKESNDPTDKREYPNVDGVKIFHVDDAERSGTPKSEPHLALLPPEKRLTGTGPATAPATSTQPPKPTPQPQAPADDFGDI